MIGYLYGSALDTGEGIVTICVGGIGYEVHVFSHHSDLSQRIVWIHEHAPQDAPHELYGFCEREQRDLFRRLLDIKGVGPKVAMRIVGTGMKDFGMNMGHERLCKIRGVGETLAQRIVEAMR